MDLGACELSELEHFLAKGGYFSSLDPKMGVRVCVRVVFVYGRLKMQNSRREIAGTAVWYPLLGDVRLRELSVSGGSTVP